MKQQQPNYPCAMTVDVEDYFHVAAFENTINPNNWSDFETRVETNTHLLLNLFERKNLKATFFYTRLGRKTIS